VVEVHSDWFASVSLAETSFALAAFEKVERLLGAVQPEELDRVRSTATFADDHVQINLHHLSAMERSDLAIHYTKDSGGLSRERCFRDSPVWRSGRTGASDATEGEVPVTGDELRSR